VPCGLIEVKHGGHAGIDVDDLSEPGQVSFPQRCQDAGNGQHRAAAEVADEVQRRDRAITGAADSR
jgi:hypothetical protein